MGLRLQGTVFIREKGQTRADVNFLRAILLREDYVQLRSTQISQLSPLVANALPERFGPFQEHIKEFGNWGKFS